VKRFLFAKALGWDIHPTARFGSCVLFRVAAVSLDENARIQSGSVYRNLRNLTLGRNAVIGSWNWVSCSPLFFSSTGSEDDVRRGELILGADAAVTSRHYIDCSGGVFLDNYAVLAGVRSTVMTHQVDTQWSRQSASSVRIGHHSLVSSNVKIAPGASIPDQCMVAMGSVVTGALGQRGTLYAGVPARPVKSIGEGLFFRRQTAGAGPPSTAGTEGDERQP
jgi:acetyltransferase-like isoleucine patch superfamily enzyme